MLNGLLGKKLGMTQIFKEDGTVIPVTIIEAGPCTVVQKKTVETDGYNAVQVGFIAKDKKGINKPTKGHFDKAKTKPVRSEEHTSELQSQSNLVCRLML